MSLLWPWNASRTEVSMKSTTSSMAACSLPGRPVVMFFATLLNRKMNTSPSNSEKAIESTLMRPEIALAVVPDPPAVRTAHLQIGEVMLDVFAGRFRRDRLNVLRPFLSSSSSLLCCADAAAEQQGTEHHQLRGDEAREHRQRLRSASRSRRSPRTPSAVSSTLPISPSHAARIIAPRSRRGVGFSTRAAKKPFGTTAATPPSNADVAQPRPNQTHNTRRQREAHTACASNVNGTTCLHVNHHNGPLVDAGLAEGLGGSASSHDGAHGPTSRPRRHSKRGTARYSTPARRKIALWSFDVGEDALELVETVVADHDATALRAVLDGDRGAERLGEIGLEAAHVRDRRSRRGACAASSAVRAARRRWRTAASVSRTLQPCLHARCADLDLQLRRRERRAARGRGPCRARAARASREPAAAARAAAADS